jgi:hypothetical protein
VEDRNPAAVEICSECFSLLDILMLQAFCHASTLSIHTRSWRPRAGKLVLYCVLLPWMHATV